MCMKKFGTFQGVFVPSYEAILGAVLFIILPGLVGAIFDGIQRPLPSIKEQSGDFIQRGVTAPPLPEEKKWHFNATLEKGAQVSGGDVLGTVQETSVFLHKILVPPNIQGKLIDIVASGEYTIKDVIAKVETATGPENLFLSQRWPVRIGRPYTNKIRQRFPSIQDNESSTLSSL